MIDKIEAENSSRAGRAALALMRAAPGADQPLLTDITAEDEARVEAYVARASAASTMRAYRSDWQLFTEWCSARGYQPLPARPR